MKPTLTVLYTYDETAGIFVGTLPNGTQFRFTGGGVPVEGYGVAAVPVKLKLELGTLARQTVDLAKQVHAQRAKTLGSPMLSDEEHSALLDEYLRKGGLIQQVGVKRSTPKGRATGITLEDLGLGEDEDFQL